MKKSIFKELKECPRCKIWQDKKMGKCINIDCDYIFYNTPSAI